MLAETDPAAVAEYEHCESALEQQVLKASRRASTTSMPADLSADAPWEMLVNPATAYGALDLNLRDVLALRATCTTLAALACSGVYVYLSRVLSHLELEHVRDHGLRKSQKMRKIPRKTRHLEPHTSAPRLKLAFMSHVLQSHYVQDS